MFTGRMQRPLLIGLLIAQAFLVGVFWVVPRLVSGGLLGLIGLAVVIVDLALIFGVLRSRRWTRSVILLSAPPFSLYVVWIAFWASATAPQVRHSIGGHLSMFEVARVLVPTLILIITAAILSLAWVSRSRLHAGQQLT